MLETLGEVLPASARRFGDKTALVAGDPQPDEMKDEIAKAYVVPKPGEEADEESFVAHCREHLAAYKVPRAIQFVDDVPETSTGKIMRRELKTLDA